MTKNKIQTNTTKIQKWINAIEDASNALHAVEQFALQSATQQQNFKGLSANILQMHQRTLDEIQDNLEALWDLVIEQEDEEEDNRLYE